MKLRPISSAVLLLLASAAASVHADDERHS